jgi:hypothetical protein
MRMLLRYTHLCIPALAKRLNEAFADERQVVIHRGQRRLKKGAELNMKLLSNAPAESNYKVEVPHIAEAAASNVAPFRRKVA